MDVSGIALDVATVLAVASLVAVALASIWPVRKVIATINKS